GQFKFAISTTSCSFTCFNVSVISSSFKPSTAAIVPCPFGKASSIKRPLVWTSGNASDKLSALAATSALYSPRLCPRSEEHTSELQSRFDLVCRLLLEKKKTTL